MLVLSRHRGEAIMIGDDVEITVVDIRGDKVRLGVSAPKEIPVHRREVYLAIQQENREATAKALEASKGCGTIQKGQAMNAAKELKLIRAALCKAVEEMDSPNNVKAVAARMTIACAANAEWELLADGRWRRFQQSPRRVEIQRVGRISPQRLH